MSVRGMRLTTPGLPVPESQGEVGPGKGLSSSGELVVCLESGDDTDSLVVGEEPGRVGEVVNEPEADDCDDDGDDSLTAMRRVSLCSIGGEEEGRRT